MFRLLALVTIALEGALIYRILKQEHDEKTQTTH